MISSHEPISTYHINANTFVSAYRIAQQEYERANDCYLYILLSNMDAAPVVDKQYHLDTEDYDFLIKFLGALLEASELPYVQSMLDKLLAAPFVIESEADDAETE